MHTQTHVTARMRKTRKGITRKKSRSCGVGGSSAGRVYLVSPVGGEEPRRGDFGETYTRRGKKNGFDLTQFICKCRNSQTGWGNFYGIFKWILTGEGGFAKLRWAYKSTAMSFWLASRAMDRAVLPSCQKQEKRKVVFLFPRCCHGKTRENQV